MNNIYIITSGESDEYGIESVWSSKEKAEENCALLNQGKRSYNTYVVEKWPMDVPLTERYSNMVRGWKAVYNFAEFGPQVDEKNVVFTEVTFWKDEEKHMRRNSTTVEVRSVDKQECLRIVLAWTL